MLRTVAQLLEDANPGVDAGPAIVEAHRELLQGVEHQQERPVACPLAHRADSLANSLGGVNSTKNLVAQRLSCTQVLALFHRSTWSRD